MARRMGKSIVDHRPIMTDFDRPESRLNALVYAVKTWSDVAMLRRHSLVLLKGQSLREVDIDFPP